MITAGQLRAACALIAIGRSELAALSGLSVPTIQRMEVSNGVIRGNVDSLMKLIGALDAAGIELITERAVSQRGGRGVRLKSSRTDRKKLSVSGAEARRPSDSAAFYAAL